MDIVHCQRQATAAVEESRGALLEVHGQLITAAYLDGLASEVQESLQVGPLVAASYSPAQLGSGN